MLKKSYIIKKYILKFFIRPKSAVNGGGQVPILPLSGNELQNQYNYQ